jgi:hypothetical protein
MKMVMHFFLFSAVALPGAMPAAAQADSTAFVKESPVKILIAKTDTYLENTVAALISDSLSSPSCIVTSIPLRTLSRQNRRDFTVIVLFNAVKQGQINSAVNKYIRSTENSQTPSNLLICTVYGEKWKGKETAADAVTTATKTLNPVLVAARVLTNIRLAIQEKK